MKTITKFIYLGLASLALACFAVSPAAQAAGSQTDTTLGKDALKSITTGINDTAVGYQALRNNTTGSANTATGSQSLFSNTTGNDNTATGTSALQNATTGDSNTANGAFALQFNTTGFFNTATGFAALLNNTAGDRNTADGRVALIQNTTGSSKVATGNGALFSNTGGSENTGIGNSALGSNTTGSDNIALGIFAGSNLTTGDNNIDIYDVGVAGESNTIRIGTTGTHAATYIAGISGTAVVGDTVVVDGNGQLGTVASSARFKKEIRAMDKTSEAILALKPVSFQYKSDSKGTPQFGLIAEEVAKVNPDLVVRDPNGEIYSVRYEAVNAMLLNEFLKEHRQVQEQQKQIEKLTAQLQEQAEQIRKVNDKVEMNRPARQMVVNDR